MLDFAPTRSRSLLTRAALCLAAAGLVSAGPYRAAAKETESSKTRNADGWKSSFADIEKDLRAKKYSDANRKSSDLALVLLTKSGQGGSTAQLLSRLCAYRAISESETGDASAGLWHWRMAQTLDKGIDGADLHAFGPSAERLKGTPFRGQFPKQILDRTVPSGGSSAEPKALTHPGPMYPNGMAIGNIEARYRVEFVVDTDGTVKEPLLLSPDPEPGLLYANMESLRQWTFQPAMIEGHSVPFLWVQEIALKTKP